MSQQKSVIVYAASGYTGRLVCLQLTRMRVPFVAAGRHQGRLDAVASECRAQGADCSVQVAEHTLPSLQQLLRGAKVIINTSGPFSALGRVVVQAALAEGCHYFDSAGEQDFLLDTRREFADQFARAKLVVSPSAAFLWAPGACLAELLLEVSGIDTVKIVYAPGTLQTVASLQSMLRSGRRPNYRLVNRELALIPPFQVRHVVVPGTDELRGAIACGGAEATYLQGDSRLRNCDALFASDSLVASMPTARKHHRWQKIFGQERVDRWTDAMVLKHMQDPPEEQLEWTRFVVNALGEGNNVRSQIVLHGAASYLVTGFLGALAAKRVLDGDATKFGYVSMGQTFGARSVLNDLEDIGVKMIEQDAPRVAVAMPSGRYEVRSA